MAVSHITLDFGLGNQRRNGVHHNDIHSAGTDHGFGNLQCLLSVVRLRDVQIVYVNAYILGIYGIQRVLCVYEACNASLLLHLRHHMQGYCGLTTGLRPVYLHDSSSGNPAQPQRDIQAQRACRNGLHIHLRTGIAQLHHCALSELFLDLADGRI